MIQAGCMAWPQHGRFLIPGVNDTWNEFQKTSMGKMVSSQDWKKARASLHLEFEEYIASGGIPIKAADESCRQEVGRDLEILMTCNLLYIFMQERCDSFAQRSIGYI